MATILLVDDDVSLLAALGTDLERAGYTVLRASDVDNGAQLLEPPPDLVILEVNSDGGAGWELLSYAVRRGTPVLVLTSRAREEEVVEALEAGAVDVLSKPYRTNELFARIRSRLGTPAPASSPPVSGYQPAARQLPPAEEAEMFMDHAAERELMSAPTAPVEPLAQPIEDLPLGERLRAARQSRRQSLVQVNLETKSNIAIWYLQAMEEEKFGLLPRGPLAAQMVREYAEYLGLNGAHALADFRRQHDIGPFQPLPSLGGRPEPRTLPRWLAPVAGLLVALVLLVGGLSYSAKARSNVGVLGQNIRGAFARATPTPTPTNTPLPATITPVPTLTSTPTALPTATATATDTPVPTATLSPPSPTTVPPPPPSPVPARPAPTVRRR
ncbi:MAG: response regulator [Herpetosiphonaceae bacterium]|nr:response regulator [Herpetosiphonaceae bacterium]